jgi:beta-lactamase class A
MIALLLGLSAVLVQPVDGPATAKPTLESVLAPIVKANKAKIAIAVKHLETGEQYTLNADEPMPTASLIKTAIMVETYWQAEEKKVELTKTLTLQKEDKVPGAGILTDHFSDGATFSLRDAVRLMIVYSDNTGTNMVLDQVGIKNVNQRMEKLGFPHTKINAKVYRGSTTSVDPARTKQYGLGSTTANESVKLFEMIHAGKVVSPAACETMLGHLKANDDKEMLVRFLPEGTVVAHKTGAVSTARTEAGIIYLPDAKDKKLKHPVAVCVLLNEIDDKRWVIDNAAQLTIANVGKAVYGYFTAR